MTRLENESVPTVAVATTEFMHPARVQAAALGRADADCVYVEHPIQDQTEDEIKARADQVVAELAKRLTSN